MEKIMIKAIKAAGDILENHFGKQFDITRKRDKGFVSQPDQEAEKIILSTLTEKYNYNVIAEESGVIEKGSEFTWVIDPLDGTSNYIRQIPLFCISIALLKNSLLEAGVIYHPLSKELFHAKRGKGAFLNGSKLLNDEVSEPVIIDCNLGYGKEPAKKYLYAIKGILPFQSSIRNFGSSALELAYLAAGRIDCFISYGDELYDLAAGILLTEEAGNIITNWKGDPWKPGDKGLLVAPPLFHREILNGLNKSL